MRQLLMALLLSLPALGIAQEAKEQGLYSMVEEFYSKGHCKERVIPADEHRYWTLVFLEDVLSGTIGRRDAVTSEMWRGDFDVFRLGRTPDKTLVALHDYASRKDVRHQVIKDIDAIKKSAEEYDVDREDPIFLLCEIYKMSNGMKYYFRKELHAYYQTLNRRIRHKNIEALLDAQKLFE